MTGAAQPVLAARGLTRDFGSERTLVHAVSAVDLDVAGGEMVLVMGPSGSGKTTLLTMLGALLRPTSGTVCIEGTEIGTLGRRELARVRRERVGFVFQTFNLLESLTASENVQLALNVAGVRGAAAAERAASLLIAAGLGERLAFRARDLSSGEKQRVSLARALANRPRLLLADEPTANLDSRNGRDVAELLQALAHSEGVAVLVVTHDERLRDFADRILQLEDGRVVAEAAALEPVS